MEPQVHARILRLTFAVNQPQDPQLTVILNRFGEAWASGAAPDIVAFLPNDAAQRRTVLIELIMVDLERRWRANASDTATLPPDTNTFPSRPTLEDYVSRYADLGEAESLPLELICEEYRVRRLWGDKPGHDEYLRRFSAQRDELRAALAKADDEAAFEGDLLEHGMGDDEDAAESEHDEGAA